MSTAHTVLTPHAQLVLRCLDCYGCCGWCHFIMLIVGEAGVVACLCIGLHNTIHDICELLSILKEKYLMRRQTKAFRVT